MDQYEVVGPLGEGTYGVVSKCRHRQGGQLVAIKKFKDSDADPQVRKTAMREVQLLKRLKHDNIVSLIDVFRRKGKLYIVFEYCERYVACLVSACMSFRCLGCVHGCLARDSARLARSDLVLKRARAHTHAQTNGVGRACRRAG